MEFIFLFLYRALSGAQNGLGYAGSPRINLATTGMLIMCLGLAAAIFLFSVPVPYSIGAALCALLAFISAILVSQSFSQRGGFYDIHLWESVTTGAITIGVVLAGGNIVYVAASIYPALIFHKGFINLGSGLKWWDSRTDDKTGKTFTIPLLGLKVPRSSTRARILLAAASLLLAALAAFFPDIDMLHPKLIH